MKIGSIVCHVGSVGFGCALTAQEEKDFAKTESEAKKALGISDGMSVFKVFSQSLPDKSSTNTGIGKLNSDSSLQYLKFMKLYTGANIIKEYPVGEMSRHTDNYYCPYNRISTIIGEDNINLHKLTTKEYGNLLSESDVSPFICENKAGYGFDKAVNFENELGTTQDFPILKPLRTAYNNMNNKNTPEAVNIRKEFEDFKSSIDDDFYNRLALYPIIADKNPDFFKGIDNSKTKQNEYKKLTAEHKDEIDFFKFRKFIATKEHNEARKNLKKEGLELFGDCPIGFSPQEVWAFPDAFYPQNISPGWNFRSINYEDIIKEGTPANRLFTQKLKYHMQNYDGIRFDVGWQYVKPNLKDFSDMDNPKPYRIEVGDKILKLIEKTAYEVKGEDYDTRKLMYESDAGMDDYQLFDYSSGKPVVNPLLKGRTSVLSTQYENAEGDGWGNPRFFNKFGLNDYIIGTNNHDGTPLRALAEDEYDINGETKISLPPIRRNNIKALQESLKLNKKETEALNNPDSFVKAKFAELFTAKNQFLFFNDVMGNKRRLDEESSDPANYRIRIDNDYESQYHSAIQNNHGFNLMEALKIAMKSKNLDKTSPVLYGKVKDYADYLAKEGPKTKQEAQKAYEKGTGGFEKYRQSKHFSAYV